MFLNKDKIMLAPLDNEVFFKMLLQIKLYLKNLSTIFLAKKFL